MSADRSANLPWWRTQGFVVAGGWHPLAARLRCEPQPEHVEDDYAWEYSEAHVKRLAQLGVTVLISQFDRGLGDSDQEEDQKLAVHQAALCHKHGLKHGVYLPNTIYFESMRKDHPDCDDWAVRTFNGQFAYYGGQQTFRWIACFNAPGWRSRIETQIRTAINKVRTDLLHFDNLGVWPEPESCHCRYCRDAFRAFLVKRYPTPEQQKRRFGFAGVESFDPPAFNMSFSPPWTIDRFTNPLMQDWIDFRCATVTDYIRQMATFARELKSDICIDSNGQSLRGENQALLHGTEHEPQAMCVDAVWDENPDYRPSTDPSDRDIFPIERKFRGMNLLTSLGRQVLTAYADEESLAFNLTFAGDPGINLQWGYAEPGRLPLRPAQQGVEALLAHRGRHRHLYTCRTPAARIALWRNHASLAYISTDTHLSACVLEQLLFERRIPFRIVTDGFIRHDQLAAFDLLIVPNVEYVSDAQAACITDFVAAGGALLVTENTGRFTGGHRRRDRLVFADLFEAGQRVTHGCGRAAHLASIDYVHRAHAFRSGYCTHYDGIDSRYWRQPRDADRVFETLRWLQPRLTPVSVDGVPELRTNVVTLADGSVAVLLVRCGQLATPVDVSLTVHTVARPRDALYYRPESNEPTTVTWTVADAGFSTTLPNLARHAVLCYIPE